MMLDKKQFSAFVKYLLMYLCVFVLVHVTTNATLDKMKCNIIALGASTMFIALDYVAPTCVTKIESDISVGNCDYNVGMKNHPLSFQ